MRAVTIMYDSLNRKYLPCYGKEDIVAPNFKRLEEKSVVFDNAYAGSLPCMPARRELHTGRYNFLHRSWSPLEPFDESMPEILSNHGICTQFVSDHCHYWQDGGLTYHTRYSAFEMVRGQEGDEWHARAKDYKEKRQPRRMDKINRTYTRDEKSNHARCFESAKDFIENNHNDDNWYLHLEYFDPHEPFDVPEKYKRLYTDKPTSIDWPKYMTKDEQKDVELDEVIINYKAAVSMCDDYLGKVLDLFDKYNLWKDTLLILCTDHGFMLGEHNFVAKNYMPCYDEIVHLPLMIYAPRHPERGGERNNSITQTIDIAPTLLDWFNAPIPENMQGKSLLDTLENNSSVHNEIIFGYFGKHINIFDGRYVYMRAARDNKCLNEYMMIPTRLASLFTKRELKMAKCYPESFDFAYHIPMLKIPAHTPDVPNASHHQYDEHMKYGDLLFDLKEDPNEDHNIVNERPEIVERLSKEMVRLMKESEAPKEQYKRMGLDYNSV